MRWAVLVLAALALTGCETTEEKSAQLEKKAKLEQARNPALAQNGLSIKHPSTKVRVLSAMLLHSSEGDAAVVTVLNTSASALAVVPIEITVKGANGQTLFQNTAAGLEAALVSVPSIPAHGRVEWVNDQVPASTAPATLSAEVGEGHAVTGALPVLSVAGVQTSEDPSAGAGVSGTINNHSHLTQHNLVVFAVARRAGKIVAAGRAVLPEVPAGGSHPFQAYFVGEPAGAQLEVAAPASTLG